MQNRQKDEILRDILTVCNGGAPITKVMFHAYITHGQAKAYLQHLITSELVEHDPLDRRYYATPKGMEYLNVVGRMAELFPVATKRAAKERSISSFL
jgi:predicted transcriptional regulator